MASILDDLDPEVLAELQAGGLTPQAPAPAPQAPGVAPMIAPQAAPQAPQQAPQPQNPFALTPDDAIAMAAKAHPWRTGLRLVGGMLSDVGQGLAGQQGTASAGARAQIYQDTIGPILAQQTASMFGMGGQPAAQGQPQAGGQPQGASPAPAQGSAAPVSAGAAQLQQVAQLRKLAAMRAMMSGDMKGAAELFSPSLEAVNGVMVDKNTGQQYGRVGVNLTNVNGTQVDPNDPANANRFVGAPPTAGAEPVYNQQGQPVGWHMADGSIQALQQSTAATEGAKAAANAPYTPIKVANPNGSESTISAAQFAGQGGGQAPATSSAGGGQGAGFTGQGTADKAFAENDAKALSTQLQSDAAAREPALQAQTAAAQALAFAKAHKMTPITPISVALANAARSTGLIHSIGPYNIDQFAADAANYERNATQGIVTAAHASFPSRITNSDLKLVQKVIPQLKDPNESSAVYWATQQALAERQQQHAEFASQYGADPASAKSSAAYANAWNNGPGGKSIFQSPAFQDLRVGGKPVVQYRDYNGQRYGVVQLGGGATSSFKVQ